MQKRRTRYHARLLAELASLRKGRGITPIKMQGKSALREVIARIIGINSNGITNSQIHNQLLTVIARMPHTTPMVALRYALSLTEEVKGEETLLQRRRRLARILGKHPDTIIRYENQAIDDLAWRLKELGEDGSPTTPTVSPVQSRSLKQLANHTSIIRDTAVLSLSGLLPVANRAPDLVQYLEQSQRPYLEMEVQVKFLPSSRGQDWYRLEVRYIFSGVRDTFRLAVVMENEDGEQLLTQGLVDDFHKLNDRIDPAKELRTILNSSKFTAYNRVQNSQKLLRFRELERNLAETLLLSADKPTAAPCRFLEVSIPPQWQNEDTTYEYRSTFNLRDDIHYAYWYAPSMMFVKNLTFDYSKFPDHDKWKFVALPFLGNLTGRSIRGAHSFTVRPNDWIMPGHGIALIWEAQG